MADPILQTLPITEKRTAAFWRKVEVRGPDDCWTYKPAARTQGGYGASFYGDVHTTAQRIAYVLARGPFPKSLHVLHRCNRRDCLNPRHLFLGTPQGNSDDMVAKARSTKGLARASVMGERNANVKLTDEQIQAILRLGATYTQRELARMFAVSKSQIGNILRAESRAVRTPIESGIRGESQQ
jgi:hypothetical protein